MTVIGLVPVFEEAGNIGDCVESMLHAGCDRVVCLDGAYKAADGHSFMGGGVRSDDGTVEIAEQAGATVIVPTRQPRFGEKRQLLLELCDASPGDHVLFMDADERAFGRLADVPDGHACVLLRNLKPNDLPDIRMEWPHGDAGPAVPLLRLLRWTPGLRFLSPGQFSDEHGLVTPYLNDSLELYEVADQPRLACALPLLDGIEIHHVAEHTPERVAWKRRFYPSAA